MEGLFPRLGTEAQDYRQDLTCNAAKTTINGLHETTIRRPSDLSAQHSMTYLTDISSLYNSAFSPYLQVPIDVFPVIRFLCFIFLLRCVFL